MYCGRNKTALTSQRQIARALMALMTEKPYEQISVCELCREAGISRQTFYSLFSSRENVVVFTLQAQYGYDPEESLQEEPPREVSAPEESSCGIRSLCRGYSRYILQHQDFLRLLVQNHIDYLLYDSIYEALEECGGFLKQQDPCTRRYAASFYAGGVSSVARCYAMEGCAATAGDLEEMLYTFFTGKLF